MRAISQGAIVAMALLLCHPYDADAQTLKGLKRIGIYGVVQGDNNDNCGITKEDLETAVGFIAQQSRLQIATDKVPVQGFLQARAQVLVLSRTRDLCVVGVNLTFTTNVIGNSSYGPYNEPVTAVWNLSNIGSGDHAFVKKAATDFMEQATKAFIVQWSKENQ